MNTATNLTTPARPSPPSNDRVAAVIRRLTRAAITDREADMIRRLAPGKHARWVHGPAKRFLRSLQSATTLTHAQRRWLAALWRHYGPRR